MIINNINNMDRGWFIGNFVPSVHTTEDFEVGFKEHSAGEQYGYHYHKVVKEINLLISGKMKIHDQELNPGDIFILDPYEIADPVFLTNCQIVCIKIPGLSGDKVNI